jgi:hypothetical protein
MAPKHEAGDDPLVKNVFVLGLDDFQRGELETVTNASRLAFHGLLDKASLLDPDQPPFTELLDRARRELEAFEGSIDALIAHWDFPTSVLTPILAREHGLPAASLEAVLACEHKHWSRICQKQAIPEAVPAFAAFDPFDDDALEKIDVPFPFWVKPVKAFSSQLGFKIENEEQFHEAMREMRAGIHRFGDVFNEVLQMADLPDMITQASGNTCLAEQLVSGRQLAPEGAVANGEFEVHGVFDMPQDEAGLQWSRLVYPAQVPDDVQKRMIDLSERFLDHIGYDDGCFNVEFLWEEETDQLWVIEVNTRISQSHSDLFAKVDGMSNHEVALDVALGVPPSMPHQRGAFAAAAKCILYTREIDDGIVTRVPTEEEIQRLVERYPETHVDIQVQVGDRLSELSEQSSYRYDLGTIHIGGQSAEEVAEGHRAFLDELPFEFEPVPDA